MFGGRREETKEAPFVESSKRPLSSLVYPLYLQTLTSPSIPPERGLNFFSVTKMSGSNEGQPGDVRSPSFCLHQLFDPVLTVGSPRISEINLDTVYQNVCPTLFHTFSTFSFTPQHRKLFWRPLLAHRPAFHSLPCFPHRVSRCATIYLKHRAHYIPLFGLQHTGASVQSSLPQYRKAKHQRIAPAVFSNGSSVHSRANTPHVTKRWVQRRSQFCYLSTLMSR